MTGLHKRNATGHNEYMENNTYWERMHCLRRCGGSKHQLEEDALDRGRCGGRHQLEEDALDRGRGRCGGRHRLGESALGRGRSGGRHGLGESVLKEKMWRKTPTERERTVSDCNIVLSVVDIIVEVFRVSLILC